MFCANGFCLEVQTLGPVCVDCVESVSLLT